jgi:hypothetical protein
VLFPHVFSPSPGEQSLASIGSGLDVVVVDKREGDQMVPFAKEKGTRRSVKERGTSMRGIFLIVMKRKEYHMESRCVRRTDEREVLKKRGPVGDKPAGGRLLDQLGVCDESF